MSAPDPSLQARLSSHIKYAVCIMNFHIVPTICGAIMYGVVRVGSARHYQKYGFQPVAVGPTPR
jgi:hypothetical protein